MVMDQENPQNMQHKEENSLPQLLVMRPPQLFTVYEQGFCKKFNVLKAYESPLPRDQFLQKHAKSAKALLSWSKAGPVNADLLRLLPSLQLVVTAGTGFDYVDLPECNRRGIAVANTADVFSEDTADAAVGLLIDVLRKISAGDRFVRQGLWPIKGDYGLSSKLGNRRVGLVGYGNVGSKIAKRLDAFGCSMAYTARKEKQSAPYHFYPSVSALASHCNVLIICCSLTRETHHMIDKDVLRALGKKGIVINVGRGPIIDEKALVKFLVEGEIAGAGLDVFEDEPNVPKELFELDNVVMNPHKGGFTDEALLNSFQMVMGNLEAFFSGKPLLSPVRSE